MVVGPSCNDETDRAAQHGGSFGLHTGGHGNYGSPKNGSTDDAMTHQTVAQLHMDVLRAAYLCDMVRVGTFQWSPGTNHVGFKGFYPGDDNGIYQHHP